MQFNVSQLLKAPVGTTRDYTLDEEIAGIDKELQIRAPLRGAVHMLRTAEGILVTSRLTTQVQLECVRCLDRFDLGLQLAIEEEFHPSLDILGGAPLPVPAGEEGTAIDEHHSLDLSEVVRQSIFLSIPMSPACRESCVGLCAQCGQNLNEDPAHRHAAPVDPRLAILREIG